MPKERTRTRDAAPVAAATPTNQLVGDDFCDFDGNRLERIEVRTVGDTEYIVKQCSADPAHIKMIPK